MFKIIAKLLLLFHLLPFHSMGQNDVVSFLNEKILSDSLFYLKLSPKVAYIDEKRVCSTIKYLQESELSPFNDTVFTQTIQDTSISKEDFNRAFDKHLVWCDKIESKFSGLDSICKESINTITCQVKKNNKQKRHPLKNITATKNIIRNVNKNSKGYFSLSNPIFINNQRIALIWVNIIWGPLYGRGYFEIYRKNKSGNWERISKIMIWMS